MKNITISLDDDIYRQARVAAAQADTSVTALVREFFAALSPGESTEKVAVKSMVREAIDEIRKRHPDFDPSSRLTREETHSRSSLS